MKTRALLLAILVIIFLSASQTNAQPKLWGNLPYAGKPGAGLVYEFNLNGKIMSDIHPFEKFEGEDPDNAILLADNNKFYGIADGGYGQFGSFIYEYDPATNEYYIVQDFFDPTLGVSYSAGEGYLMQAANGLIYGLTQNGGANQDGQLFSYDPAQGIFKYLADFDALITGSAPMGVLTEAPDGKLYGITHEGGLCNYGTIFSYDLVGGGAIIQERCFDWNDGVEPFDGLVLASNGLLYGMTYAGGGSGDGVIFSFETGTGIYTMLHEFNTSAHGGKPYGRLFQASDGALYGTASAGGLNGEGILFKFDINLDLFSLRINFDGTNGAYPNGSLIEYEGYLYGVTTDGGVSDEGLLFRYDKAANTITKLADFYGNDYGKHPYGTLAIGPEGKLFGQTYLGGKYGSGIMFDYNTATSVFTKRFDFMQSEEGSLNIGGLMLGTDGWVYGTTREGGEYQGGTIYRINPADREFEHLYDFDIYSYGSYPSSRLMQASDGYFYGVTPNGGTVDDGIIYRFDANNKIVTVLEDLFTPSEGARPSGTPVQAADGFLYGLTNQGGAMNDGALYKFNLSNSTYAKIADFQDAASGSRPEGSLVEAANGKLYALAQFGGQFASGTLFEYDPVGATFFSVVQFDGVNKGSYPIGTLLEYEDNKLYGMCLSGGSNGSGTIFVYDAVANVCTKVHDFNVADDGANPYGSLMKASNGNIYGATGNGGATNNGILFEYEPSTGNYTILHDFETYRQHSWHGALLEVETEYGIEDRSGDISVLSLYPNPANEVLKISSKQWVNSRVNIKVINQLGQLVLEHNAVSISSATIELNVESLEPGIYFIRCRDEQGKSSLGKFVKAK